MIIRFPSKLLDLSPLSLFDARFIRAADTKFKFQFLRAFAENQNLHRLRMIWEGIHKRDSPAFDWWLECEQQRNSQNYPLSVSFPYFQTILSIHNWKIARLLFTELDQSKLTSKIFSRRTKSLFSKIFRKILIFDGFSSIKLSAGGNVWVIQLIHNAIPDYGKNDDCNPNNPPPILDPFLCICTVWSV